MEQYNWYALTLGYKFNGKKEKSNKKKNTYTRKKKFTPTYLHWISLAIISVTTWEHRNMENSWKSRRTFPVYDIRKNFVGYF